MSEKNIAVIRHFYADVFAMEKINIAAIDHYLTDDFIGHDLPPGLNGRAGYKKFISMFAASFSNTTSLKTHEVIGNGDKVVVRWSSLASHSGEFMGIPPTGRQVTLKGIDIFCLAKGRIIALWQEVDIMDILQQISAPTPSGPDK